MPARDPSPRRPPIVSRRLCSLTLSLCLPSALVEAAGVFVVRDHGAVGDGRTSDTSAINEAVEACAASGGGQVLFPPGTYLSGTIRLKSDIALLLEDGATLLGTTDLEDYESFTPPASAPESGWGRWHRALILGDGVERASIAGRGTIDGNKVFDPKGEEKMRGPHTIILGNSSDVTIRDVTVRDSANYAIFLQHCSRVEIRGVKITGGWDGVHFRGWPGRPCRDIAIVGCEMYTGDDCIAGRYWENVIVSGCILNSSCNCVRLIGPATDLTLHDCLLYGPGRFPHRSSGRNNTLAGLNLQPGAWDATEGALDRVLISDITMQNVSTPFHFSLKKGNTAGRIVVSRVTATGAYRAAASVESWADSPFETVVFRDVSIGFTGGGTLEEARLPVKAPGVDARSLPAWGFYARNVRSLCLDGVRLRFEKDDLRPAIVCDGVESLRIDGLRHDLAAGASEPLALAGVEKLDIRDTAVAVVASRPVDLRMLPPDPPGKLLAGRPCSAIVTVEGVSAGGLAEIALDWGGREVRRWVWLRPGERKDVEFRGLVAPSAGTHEARVGDLRRSVLVEPDPARPVEAKRASG